MSAYRWHRERRKAILAAHPQVAALAASVDPLAKWLFCCCPLAHLLCAVLCGQWQLHYGAIFALSGTLGAWLLFNLFNNGARERKHASAHRSTRCAAQVTSSVTT